MAEASARAEPSAIHQAFPPVARITSPQPESSATVTGLPHKIASTGTNPNISSRDG